MKLVTIAMFATLTTACVHNPPPKTTVDTNSPEWQPRTDFQWNWSPKPDTHVDVSPAENEERERRLYEASVVDIERKTADEKLQLLMCRDPSVHGDPSKECYSLLLKLCVEDAFVDMRGTPHYKPYCTRQQLDKHNPRPVFYPTLL